ncbi:ABC transporter permease subunit [Desulfohalovibrio reitneri]|uniref:ABC transporter permease subunit n=1 Tax=Desulfohalovibrio reitneri TaxID=1307759 RepID=UPI0004A6F83D|nr:ABC transporter permease subunit [Desulfohalovibrio reitneri]
MLPVRALFGPGRTSQVYGMPGQGRSLALSFISAALLLLAWWTVTASGLVEPLFLPSPGEVWQCFKETSSDGFAGATLTTHLLASISRVGGAFLLCILTAVPVGLAMGVSRVARGLADPPIEFYRPIPPLAYLPLMIIWFGIGEVSKVILIYLACFAPMVISTRAGVRSATMEQIHAAYSLGATRTQVLWHVIVKAATPEILTGMRIGLGFAWTTLVAAEMVAASQGLGFMILNAAEFLVTDVVVLGILIIGLIAFATDLLLRVAERKLVPWKGKA